MSKNSEFNYDDLKYLAVELPDTVKFYKYSGDFAKEVEAIDLMLAKPLPLALRKRLSLERIIASGLRDCDYCTSEEEFLAELRREYPYLGEKQVGELIDDGQIDYIIRGGRPVFQNSAADSALREKTEYLFSVGHPNEKYVYTFNKLRHDCAVKMLEKGSETIRATVKVSMKIDTSAPGQFPLTVHLPFPAECRSQSDVKLVEVSHTGAFVTDAPQRTVSFVLDEYGGEEIYVIYSFTRRAELVSPDIVKALPTDREAFAKYLCEDYPHIRFTPYLRALAEEISGGKTEDNPLVTARKVYDYVTKNIRYSYLRDYLYIDNLPESTALNGRGDCGAQGLLFITLCRILGVPAKWESGKTVKVNVMGSHDWAEFYAAPYGWLYTDLSSGGDAYKRGDEMLRDFFFCNVDPYRVAYNTEFQKELIPKKKFIRLDPYDNQNGEAEFADRAVGGDEIDAESLVLNFEFL